MEDHAYSFYCKDKHWQRCNYEDLEIVKVLHEKHEDGELADKEAIYRCRQCSGFYKQIYQATYYQRGFDTDEGWVISDDYFRVDEPRWKTLNSKLDVPFPLHEARRWGYTGEDHSWKNGRCNFPVQNVELTCRGAELQFVADITHDAWDHLKNKLYKCRRCGEWYLFTPLPPYPQGLLKPTNELFPLDAARSYGYDEKNELMQAARKKTRQTLQVVVQEALVLPTKNVLDTDYKSNFFCRVPGEWIENEQLKAEIWHKMEIQVFGESWQAETFPGAYYIIKTSETKIFGDAPVKSQNWGDIVNTNDNLYYFFIVSEHGNVRKVTAHEFQADIDAELKGA